MCLWRTLASYTLGDMQLAYLQSTETSVVTMRLIPAAMENLTVDKPCLAEPLVQLKLVGDDYASQYSQGRTMRRSQSTALMQYKGQETSQTDDVLTITTILSDERGHRCLHRVTWCTGAAYLTVSTEFINDSSETATLELLTSFTLGGLTPFAVDDAPNQLELYRMLSSWAMEGRMVHAPVEELHLGRTWLVNSAIISRWGQLGSMPVREYVPFAAVEDKRMGVVWAAQLTCGASWQLEAGRTDDGFVLDGGLADREFGHWMKRVAPGEHFTAPDAVLTVCAASTETASQRLLGYTADRFPRVASEQDMPVLFNEYCTTWGEPSEDNIRAICEKIRGLGLRYFVIDAGWYAQEPVGWWSTMGSWEPSPFLFPQGLDHTLDVIRENGLLPGIWFEMEVVGRKHPYWDRNEWLLKRDGVPITAGDRRFWDFRIPEVRAYLRERVIEFMRAHRIAYAKFDYNDTLGIGVDGGDSLGEGLREHIACVQEFFREIHRELPELVIEMCSSGGHRLVPSFMELSSMASFSDAHECEEIPIIAANVQRMIPPQQSQIWAVLHDTMDEGALLFKLNAGLLGRLCLSGQVLSMNADQRAVVERAIAFYHEAAPIIADGVSVCHGTHQGSYHHPAGWQAVVRQGEAGVLVVLHTFRGAPDTVRIPLPAGCTLRDACAREGLRWAVTGSELVVTGLHDLDGVGFLLDIAR